MLTVLMATRDRATILREVLESYTRLASPPGGWKLVVVDNGSRDGTAALLDEFARRLPLEALAETRPGKNAALNTGLHAVDGDLLVLTDDDAFPQADWLVRMRAAADARTGFSVFGGAIVPRWEHAPADWLAWVPAGPAFTLTPPSLAAGPTGAQGVFGPNMAIRTSILASGVRFDESIGPTNRNYAMGSETQLVRRLLRSGQHAWFAQDAVVEHFIRSDQMDRRWVLQRAARFGRGQFRLDAECDGLDADLPCWAGVPRYLFRKAAERWLSVLRATVTGDPAARFQAQWDLAYVRGEMQEAKLMLGRARDGGGVA